MRSGGPPYGLASLISGSLRSLDLERRVREQSCLLVWDEVVGEQVAGAAQPDFVKDGRLFVTTKSSVWANELTFYKSDIIARLNRRVGGPVLKEIVFKAGRIRKKQAAAGPPRRTVEPNLEGIRLTQEELDKVEAAARAAGEEAAGVLRSLMATALRLEKWKRAQGWTPCKRCGSLQNAASGICPPCQIGSQES